MWRAGEHRSPARRHVTWLVPKSDRIAWVTHVGLPINYTGRIITFSSIKTLSSSVHEKSQLRRNRPYAEFLLICFSLVQSAVLHWNLNFEHVMELTLKTCFLNLFKIAVQYLSYWDYGCLCHTCTETAEQFVVLPKSVYRRWGIKPATYSGIMHIYYFY